VGEELDALFGLLQLLLAGADEGNALFVGGKCLVEAEVAVFQLFDKGFELLQLLFVGHGSGSGEGIYIQGSD